MKFQKQLRQLERLDGLIRLKATGPPKQLADRFGISERTMFKLLDALKSFGAQIEYCRQRQSYYYSKEIKFRFNVVVQPEKAEKIKGGKFFLRKNLHCSFSAVNPPTFELQLC